jgi:hypothetical protein
MLEFYWLKNAWRWSHQGLCPVTSPKILKIQLRPHFTPSPWQETPKKLLKKLKLRDWEPEGAITKISLFLQRYNMVTFPL